MRVWHWSIVRYMAHLRDDIEMVLFSGLLFRLWVSMRSWLQCHWVIYEWVCVSDIGAWIWKAAAPIDRQQQACSATATWLHTNFLSWRTKPSTIPPFLPPSPLHPLLSPSLPHSLPPSSSYCAVVIWHWAAWLTHLLYLPTTASAVTYMKSSRLLGQKSIEERRLICTGAENISDWNNNDDITFNLMCLSQNPRTLYIKKNKIK